MIREFIKETDEDTVIDIWLKASYIAHDFVEAEFWRNFAPTVRNVLLPSSTTYVYTTVDNNIIGFISINVKNNFLHALFVSPDHQGKGIGRQLIDHVKKDFNGSMSVDVYEKNKVKIEDKCREALRFNPSIQDFKRDRELNNFLHYNAFQHRFEKGPKWYNTGLESDDPFLLITFLGPNGSGKSTLMRTLCQGYELPLPSTETIKSMDVQLYQTNTLDIDKNRIVLMADCEGLTTSDDYHDSNEKIVYKRKKFISLALCPILYECSEVLVYVSQSCPIEKIYQQIQRFFLMHKMDPSSLERPHHLVIVLNRAYNNNSERAKNTFSKYLGGLFKSLSIIDIPDIQEEGMEAFFGQIRTLRFQLQHLVSKCLNDIPDEKNRFLTKMYKIPSLERKIQFINEEHALDLYSSLEFDCKLHASPPILGMVSRSLFEYFKSWSVYYGKKEESILAFKNSVLIMKQMLIPFIHRFYEEKGMVFSENFALQDFFIPILKELSYLINSYMPCEYSLSSTTKCTIRKEEHKDFHQHSIYNWGINSSTKSNGNFIYPFLKVNLLGNVLELIIGKSNHLMKHVTNSPGICTLCPPRDHSTRDTEPTKDLPQNAGFRILSLDGGGIRGIVECFVLVEIHKLCFNIPITSLFDFIIGTSTGGIVAISIALGKSPVDGIDLFENLAKEAFVGIGNKNSDKVFLGSSYRRSKLHNTLLKVIPPTPLIISSPKVKLAITSVKMTSGEKKFYLFRSYPNPEPISLSQKKDLYDHFKKKKGKGQVDFLPELFATCVDAAEATSAAPTYFPQFTCPSGSFLDGGVLANNPCLKGYREAQHIFNPPGSVKRKCDIVTSLGTGQWLDKSVNKFKSGFIGQMQDLGELVSDTMESTEELRKIFNVDLNLDKSVFFRINPEFSRNYELDDCNKIGNIKSEMQLLVPTIEELKPLSLKLLSSLFHVNGNIQQRTTNDQILNLSIVSRINLPIEMVEKINQHQEPFRITANVIHLSPDETIIHPIETNTTGQYSAFENSIFSQPFSLLLPTTSTHRYTIKLEIICQVSFIDQYIPKPETNLLISGCPLFITIN
eukprot:gene8594-10576_t